MMQLDRKLINRKSKVQILLSAICDYWLNYWHNLDNYWVPNKPPTITAKLCTITNIDKVDTNNNFKQLPSIMGKLFRYLQVKSP